MIFTGLIYEEAKKISYKTVLNHNFDRNIKKYTLHETFIYINLY